MQTLTTFMLFVLLTLPATSLAQGKSALELRQEWQDIAQLIAATGNDDASAEVLKSIDGLSDQQLIAAYGDVDLIAMIDALHQVEDAVGIVDSLGGIAVREIVAGKTGYGTIEDLQSNDKSAGFPDDLDYPDPNYCPYSPGRSDGLALQIAMDAITAGRIALEAAKVIWSGVSRACDQTVVILGEGGNTSLACIAADVVLFAAELVVGAAEGVVEHFSACDSGVDSAEIEGTWLGVQHNHEDLQDLQDTVDENQRLITIMMSRQLEVMRLLLTPEGGRAINPDVLSCTGADCPQVLFCRGGEPDWPCKQ